MPERKFPEVFLEIGKDDDHSYNSLKTIRQPDGSLKIEIQSWGIAEYFLFLSVETSEILKLQMTGECGTVPSKTWRKVSLSHVLEKEEEDNVEQIEYHGYAPVEIGNIAIQLKLHKRTYPKL
jgi:hypothetical protein